MKKMIAILLAIVYCLIVTGCGSTAKNTVVPEETIIGEDSIGESITSKRTTSCHICHGDGICYHCKGDGFHDGRRCSVCDGTGKCHYCNGAGKLEVVEMGGKDYTLCGSCHGSGKCSLCDGNGTYTVSFSTLGTSTTDCMLCHGSGKCLNCKGTGWVELRGF